MSNLSETILQFGAGKFLRAFVDMFVHEANEAGQNIGKIVVVQSTGDDLATALNKQGGKYHVLIRGYEKGETIEQMHEVASISRALHAGTEWDKVLEVARSPELKFVLSNTTEAGYTLDASDRATSTPPASFPGKLLLVLKTRFDAKQPGLTIIPCELMEGNAALLRQTLLDLGKQWNLSADLLAWIENECVFLHTLVDRIVSGTPKDHPMLATDPMLIVGEPFAFFALESNPKAYPFAEHPAIVRTDDVKPYFLRKVRILNAGHTALLIKAKPRGFRFVREAMADPELGAWLETFLTTEVVPTLAGRVNEGETFAAQTLDRFRNPFLDHKFSDIGLHHANKVQIRLVPTKAEYESKFGKEPPLLTEVLREAGL